MRTGSRQSLVIGLVFPAALSVLTVLVLLALLPLAPDSVVMQWSGDGPSRSGSPLEMLWLPAIAVGISLTVWGSKTGGDPREARQAMIIGNAVAAFMNAIAVALIVAQFSGASGGFVPVVAAVCSAVVAVLVGLVTFFLLRRGAIEA